LFLIDASQAHEEILNKSKRMKEMREKLVIKTQNNPNLKRFNISLLFFENDLITFIPVPIESLRNKFFDIETQRNWIYYSNEIVKSGIKTSEQILKLQ